MQSITDEVVLERAILALVTERGPNKTACPSEVARRLAPEDWRPLMPAVRAAAARLWAAGRLAITQKGVAVDPATARGAIRLGLPPGTAPNG